MTVYGGEILGIAGISGGGQKELLEAIAGLQPVSEGSITFYPEENQSKEIANLDVADIRALGVRLAFVPEDRLGMGLVGSMDMTDNIMLRSYQRGKSNFLAGRSAGGPFFPAVRFGGSGDSARYSARSRCASRHFFI